MARTCCPQYTIRLDAGRFKPGKKHRQVVNRFNHYLAEGFKPGEDPNKTGHTDPATKGGKAKGGKGGKGAQWDLMQELKRYEGDSEEITTHRFTVSLTLFPGRAGTESRPNSSQLKPHMRLSISTSDIKLLCTRTRSIKSQCKVLGGFYATVLYRYDLARTTPSFR